MSPRNTGTGDRALQAKRACWFVGLVKGVFRYLLIPSGFPWQLSDMALPQEGQEGPENSAGDRPLLMPCNSTQLRPAHQEGAEVAPCCVLRATAQDMPFLAGQDLLRSSSRPSSDSNPGQADFRACVLTEASLPTTKPIPLSPHGKCERERAAGMRQVELRHVRVRQVELRHGRVRRGGAGPTDVLVMASTGHQAQHLWLSNG